MCGALLKMDPLCPAFQSHSRSMIDHVSESLTRNMIRRNNLARTDRLSMIFDRKDRIHLPIDEGKNFYISIITCVVSI